VEVRQVSLSAVKAPSGLFVSRCDGDLTLEGLPTRCAAWWILDLAIVWRYGERRGQNRLMGGSAGRRAQRRFRDSTVYNFRFSIGGRFTSAGALSTLPPMTQLRANLDTCRLNWCDDAPPDSTITSVLTDPDGVTTHTCPVQVLDIVPGATEASETDAAMRASLIVEVPRGGWLD
jgi:hypothetical protein